MKRAALYVRVSTEEQKQHGLSVNSQIDALKDYCRDNKLYIVDTYNDAGHSARKKYTTRPALMKLLKDCQDGKIDVILFTRLDRWFRSVSDYHSVQSILDESKVSWRAIWEDYETETSNGIFKTNIMLAVAQNEADKVSDRIKSVKDWQKAQGRFVGGRIPFGYVSNKSTGTLEIDSDAEPIVREFYDTYIRTHNLTLAVNVIEKYTGKCFSHDRARRMLRNDYYRGIHNGIEMPAYLTPEMAAEVDRIYDANKWVLTKPKKDYLFTGLLRCEECGGRMGGCPHQARWTTKAGKQKKIVKTYQCVSWKTHTGCSFGVTVFEKALEKYLLSNLDTLLSDERLEAQIKPKTDAEDNLLKRKKLEAKLGRIGQRFEDGDISVEEYREKRDAIKIEISSLVIEETPAEIPTLPSNWKDIYNELDEVHKKIFWQKIIKNIIISKGENRYTVNFL